MTMTTTAYREDLARLPDAELLVRCRAELTHARSGDDHDDRPTFELLRRAVIAREDGAWARLQQLLGGQVTAWCRRSGAGEDDLDEVVQITWVKFWQFYTPAKFETARSLAEVLRYLKLCARSAVLDAVRRRRDTTGLDPDLAVADTDPTPDAECLDAEERAAFWQLVETHLHDERERLLLQLTYEMGLTSAEVQAHRPDLFPTVQDVYRITRNVLDRLRRSHGLIA
jgi:RNA polymerase sigma factor (sigma-70 family)